MNELFQGTITRRDWTAVCGILVATALICAGIYFVLIDKMRIDIQTTQAEYERLSKDLVDAKKLAANIDQLREKSRFNLELVVEFEKRLPGGAEIPRLLQEFERLASEAQVAVELNTLNRNKDQRKEEIPYSVVAKGNFHQVTDFINRLERYERYLKVSKMNITEEKQGVCTAKFTLSTYRFILDSNAKPPATAGGAAAAATKEDGNA